MEPSTCAALDAGIKEIFRGLTDTATRDTMVLMAQSRENRLVAFRQGLQDLRSRLPECERKLLALHLDLGVSDARVIGERIAKEFTETVPRVAESLAQSLRGPQRMAALRQAMYFNADVGAHASGVAGRVRN